jgi:hypothetical protein
MRSIEGTSDLMSNEQRIDIGEALPGTRIHPVGASSIAIDQVFCLIKYHDAEGSVSWSYRTSRRPNREELLGALGVQADIVLKELAAVWESE